MVCEIVLIIHLSKNSEQGLGTEFLTMVFGVMRGAGELFLYIVSTRISFIRKVELR